MIWGKKIKEQFAVCRLFFLLSLEKLRILFDFEAVALVKREGVMFVTSIYLFKIGTRGIFVDVRV